MLVTHAAPNKTQTAIKYLRRYAIVTLSYGFARAVTFDNDDWTKNYYNKTLRAYETKPILFTQGLGRIMTRSLAAVTAWPFMLYGDLVRLECALRGKNRDEYSHASSSEY